MSNRLYIFIVALIGIACGFITTHSFFFHSWTSIFLWIGVGLVVLYLSNNRRSAVYVGALYGFITLAVWLITGFSGTAAQIRGLTLIIVIAGAVGAISGAIGAIIFYWLFRRNALSNKRAVSRE